MTFPLRGLHCLRVCSVCVFVLLAFWCLLCLFYLHSYQSHQLSPASTPGLASFTTRHFPIMNHFPLVTRSIDGRFKTDKDWPTGIVYTMSNHATKAHNGIVSGLVYISSPEPFSPFFSPTQNCFSWYLYAPCLKKLGKWG